MLLNTHINEELNKTSQIYAYADASILVEVYNELNKECGWNVNINKTKYTLTSASSIRLNTYVIKIIIKCNKKIVNRAYC